MNFNKLVRLTVSMAKHVIFILNVIHNVLCVFFFVLVLMLPKIRLTLQLSLHILFACLYREYIESQCGVSNAIIIENKTHLNCNIFPV